MSTHQTPQTSNPAAQQALETKRNVRDLNTRLEMYVRTQQEKERAMTTLKNALTRAETEFNRKLVTQKEQLELRIAQAHTQLQQTMVELKSCQEKNRSINEALDSLRTRFITSESKNATLTSEAENLKATVEKQTLELDTLRKNYAALKYKYDSYELERNTFDDKLAKLKAKNDQLTRSVAQTEASAKTEKETYERLIVDKNTELQQLKTENQALAEDVDSTQTRLRHEFDVKLADFVDKREEQYRQEKDEWMRIFKEEFNLKVKTYKEANSELSESNAKQAAQIKEFRTRIEKLKQQKAELQAMNRSNEQDLEKLRTDMDNLRRNKDREIKDKNTKLNEMRSLCKAKELQYDELASIKLHLDTEIELYRKILSKAEQDSGYVSPLNPASARKARRIPKRSGMTPMGTETAGKVVETPGLNRAAKVAAQDLKTFVDDDQEMKDENSEQTGELDAVSLQFSGLDVQKGMLEIQNVQQNEICLDEYQLANSDSSAIFALPKEVVLKQGEKLRVYCGAQLYKDLVEAQEGEDKEKVKEQLVGNYEGTYVCWGRDVWTGAKEDVARLVSPDGVEVARMVISPDMVDARKGGCIVM